jgi:hypothetical protein
MSDNTKPTDSSRTDQVTAESNDVDSRSLPILTKRRGLLAALLVAGAGGVTLTQILDGDNGITGPQRDEQTEDSALLMSAEVNAREKSHSKQISTQPQYSYDKIDMEFNDSTSSIERVMAMPTNSRDGDRLVLVMQLEEAKSIREIMIGLWTDSKDSSSYEKEVKDTLVQFDLYSGTETVLGVAIVDNNGSDNVDLFVVRGRNTDAVEQLIDEFELIYDI